MKRALFGDRDHLGFAVNRCGRREDDVLYAVVAGHVKEHQRTCYVVPVVFERLLRGFAHGLEASEMNDGVDVVLGEHALACFAIEDGSLDELQLVGVGTGKFANAVDRSNAGIGKVVKDNDVVVLLKQLDAGVAADEAGTAGNQDGLGVVLAGKAFVGHMRCLSLVYRHKKDTTSGCNARYAQEFNRGGDSLTIVSWLGFAQCSAKKGSLGFGA